MQEDNQYEITKSLLGIIVCSAMASICAEISKNVFSAYNYNNGQSVLIGLISGLFLGAIIVEVFMRKVIAPRNIL